MSVWEDAQRRMRAHHLHTADTRAEQTASSAAPEQDGDEIWREDLRAPGTRLARRARRQMSGRRRTWRVAIAGAAVLVALALLFGVPAALWSTITHQPRSTASAPQITRLHLPQTFNTLLHDTVPVPPAAAEVPWMHVAPIPGTTSAAAICWADNPSANLDSPPLQIHSAVTTNAGKSWRILTLPTSAGASCTISGDGEQSSGLLLADYATFPKTSGTSTNCDLPRLYHSPDLGQSWQAVTWPAGLQYACGLHTSLEGGELYAWASSPLLNDNGRTSNFLHTADGGQTWQRTDTRLPAQGTVQVVGQRPHGKLLVTTAALTPPNSRELWQSTDDGATWQSEGVLPGANPAVYVATAPGVTGGGGWGTLYEIAETEMNGVPGGKASDYVASSTLGQAWRPLPTPPKLLTLANDPFGGQILGVAVTPGGSLVVARGAPDTATAAISYARYVLFWQPATHLWLLDSNRLPTNSTADGITTANSRTILWSIFVTLRGTQASVRLNVRGYPAIPSP